jgi:hypothetical protein
MSTEGVVEEEEVESLSTADDDDNDEKDKGKKESRKRKTSKVEKHVVLRTAKNRIFILKKFQLML